MVDSSMIEKLNKKLAGLCEEEKCLCSFGDLEGDILGKGSNCKLHRYEREYLTKLSKVRVEIKEIRARLLTIGEGGHEYAED